MSDTYNQPKDGGPAFPQMPTQELWERGLPIEIGMSLRDWFAGNLPLTDFDNKLIDLFRKDNALVEDVLRYTAALRYRNADEMLKARSQPPS